MQRTSAGFGALMVAPGFWSLTTEKGNKKQFKFREYRKGRFLAPVTCVTPDDGFYLHTFYDVVPWSPSQQYLAVTKFPYQQKTPRWNDIAEVCVIDLKNETIETVYKTKAWSFQLGANVQWGSTSDRFLYCNDIIDEKTVASANLLTMNVHQYGYAVPDRIYGKPAMFSKEDMTREGLWQTDLETNKTKLLVSFPQFLDKVEGPQEDLEYYKNSTLYCFHTKYNKQGTRIMQVLRGLIGDKGRDASLFTFNTDGSDIKQCLSRNHWNQKARFGGGGNHPNWHPDGEHIVMNCIPRWLGYEDMLFCQFKFDGSDFKVLSEQHLGSGHPSVNANSTYLLADTYPKQKWVPSPKGKVPIRLLNLNTDEEQMICSIATDVGNKGQAYKKGEPGSHYKLDPHPVWSHDYKKVCFNGAPEGRRQVYIADLTEIL